MREELRFEIEITPEDLRLFRKRVVVRAQAATARRRAARRLWTLCAMLVLTFASALLQRRFGIRLGPDLDGLVLALVLLGFFLVFYVGDQRDLQRALLDSADSRLPHRVSYAFEPEGVTFRAADREGILRWSAIEDIDETPEHLYVMHSLGQGWILPKHQVPETAAQTLRRLLQARESGTGAS